MPSKLDAFASALADLDKAVIDHRDAVEHVRATRTARTAAIRHARAIGITPGDIARRVGVTQPRITHITVGRDASK